MSCKVTPSVGRLSGIRVISKSKGLGSVEDAEAKLVEDPRFGLVQSGRSARQNTLPPFQSRRCCEE